MEATIISPLRYPGGKSAFVNYIEAFITEHLLSGCTLVEPYAGGASVSLSLLARGIVDRVVLADLDPLLYAFWRAVFWSTDEFCKLIKDTPVTLETWHELQDYLRGCPLAKYGIRRCAIAGLFLNRMNFSGILHAKPIGGMSQSSKYMIDCRFNKERLISLIYELSQFRHNVEVEHVEAISLLQEKSRKLGSRNIFVYIDPPYYEQGKKLYRYYYTDAEHRKLAVYLGRQSFPWLVSIDDHPRIREFYSSHFLLGITARYTVNSKRHADELLISNRQLLDVA